MSGSLSGTYNQIQYALSTHMAALSILQEQAATGARVNRASDDPIAAKSILGLDSTMRSMSYYKTTIDEAIGTLEIASTVIESITTDMFEVERLLTQAIGGTMDGQRTTSANQISVLIEQMVSIANTQRMGQYLFSGSASGQPPFTIEKTDGKISSVTYMGSTSAREVDVAPGVTAAPYAVGSDVFGGNMRGTPAFPPSGTGAKAGTGTSTATGLAWLQVEHDGTDYRLSIDGGLSWTTATGSTSQAVTDSRTGKVLFVDSSDIQKTGTDMVLMTGTEDLFNMLISIRDVLYEGNKEKLDQVKARASELFTSLKEHIVSSTVSVGARINGLDTLKNGMDKMKSDAHDRRSQLQDADITEVAIELSRHQMLYEMSMSVAARLMSQNLLDFLR